MDKFNAEEFKKTVYYLHLKEYLCNRMENIKESLLNERDFTEINKLQERYRTYKEVLLRIEKGK